MHLGTKHPGGGERPVVDPVNAIWGLGHPGRESDVGEVVDGGGEVEALIGDGHLGFLLVWCLSLLHLVSAHLDGSSQRIVVDPHPNLHNNPITFILEQGLAQLLNIFEKHCFGAA